MVLKGKEKEKLQEYFKAKIIGEYDLTPREREKHDAEMKAKREAEQKKRGEYVQPPCTLQSLQKRFICAHPDAKLVETETYVCEIEFQPPCPKCKVGVLKYEEYSQNGKPIKNYICQDCFEVVSERRYEELQEKFEPYCIVKDSFGNICEGKLKPKQAYPWILECQKPGCHKTYVPEEQQELPGAIKSCRPSLNFTDWDNVSKKAKTGPLDPRKYPEEFEEDGDTYKCPIYGGNLRVREDYRCKYWCGYRHEKSI